MNETTTSPRCPSPGELRAFAVGDLGEVDVDRIAGHVLECESCDRALRPLDGVTDGLLRHLDALGPDARPPDPVPEALLRVAAVGEDFYAGRFDATLRRLERLREG